MDNFEDWKFREASKRVKKRKSFYSHLASYMVTSAFLLLLNFFTSRETFWAIYPMLGWGVGLAFHAIAVFGMPGIGKDWEEKQMEKELEKLSEKEAARKWHAHEKELPSGNGLEEETEETEEKPLILKEMRKNYRDSDFV